MKGSIAQEDLFERSCQIVAEVLHVWVDGWHLMPADRFCVHIGHHARSEVQSKKLINRVAFIELMLDQSIVIDEQNVG
jgi:hypothetical protein